MIKRFLAAALLLISGGSLYGQAIPFAPSQYLNAAGTGPASLFKICTLAAGTNTPLASYATAQDALNGTNPITPPRSLDSSGRIALFLGNAAYKISLHPATGTGSTCNGTTVGAALWTYDNIKTSLSVMTITTLNADTVNVDTLNATDISAVNTTSAAITDSALTSGRVVFAGTGGLLRDDGDLTFATDTLTATKINATTSITAATLTDSALTSGRVPFSTTAGLLTDDSDLTFAGSTLTSTKVSTPEVSSTSADLSIKTVTSGNIALAPAASATSAVTTNVRFEQAMGTTIVSGSCVSGDCVIPGDGNFFLLSGTTAVDGFSTTGIQAGTIITLTTNGNLTLNDSGTVAAGFAAMKLVGGANVSMTDADLIQLIYTGSTYDQLSPVLVK